MQYSLGLCLIVKNEEDTLFNCLSSVDGIFDEIVVTDTGSGDKTVEIAKRFTDKVFVFEWIDDFAAARNYAFSKSTCDYVMWLDADDVILPADAERLKALKKKLDGKVKEFAARYDVGFDGNGSVTLSYYRERIFLRSAGLRWCGRIHEVVPLLTDCVYADFAVTHKKVHPTESGRNLRIYEKMLSEGEQLDARNEFYYARELYFNGRIDDAVNKLNTFLNRSDALPENKINACSVLADCYAETGGDRLSALFKSFEYDAPRAEICCGIGKYFFERNRNKEAIFWYETALSRKPDLKSGAFVFSDCYGFIPLLQLCVLYYAEGNVAKSVECNDKAAALKPQDKAVLFNKEFFSKIIKEF